MQIIKCINGLDCDCDHGCEKIHVRCCVLVDAYASHPVLLSVTVSCRSLSPSSTTLKPNQSLTQTMIQTQTRTPDRRQRRQRSEERRVGKECRSRWSPYH